MVSQFETLVGKMDTREKIMNAAVELFVENGLYGVATSKISKLAGVSTGTLFNYFPTKEDLILELYKENKIKYCSAIFHEVENKTSVAEQLRAIWENMWGQCSDKPLLYSYCRQIENSPYYLKVQKYDCIKRLFQLETDILHRGIDSGELVNLPVDYLILIFHCQETAIIEYLGKNRDLMHDKDFLDLAWGSVWNSIKNSQLSEIENN